MNVSNKKNLAAKIEPALLQLSEVYHELPDGLVLGEQIKVRHGQLQTLFLKFLVRDAKFKEFLELWVRSFYCS